MTSNGLPTLAIVGYGRAGKDTACEWFGRHTRLRFAGGCSWAARHHMASVLGVTPDEAYDSRHRDRDLWFTTLNNFRKEDPTKLVRLVLETSDLVCGIRAKEELLVSQGAGLIDLTVWIENPRVPVDPTVTFSRSDCDIVVFNDDNLLCFYRRLANLAKALKICQPTLSVCIF